MTGAATPSPPVDFRLVLAALAAWLVTWLGLDQPARVSFGLAGGLGLVAGGVWSYGDVAVRRL